MELKFFDKKHLLFQHDVFFELQILLPTFRQLFHPFHMIIFDEFLEIGVGLTDEGKSFSAEPFL